MVKPATTDTPNAPRYILPAGSLSNYQFTVFTSVLAVTFSNLHDTEPNSPFRQIRGYMHVQEWERFCAFFCMVFKETELQAQIYEDAISIGTRAKAKDGNEHLHLRMWASLTLIKVQIVAISIISWLGIPSLLSK